MSWLGEEKRGGDKIPYFREKMKEKKKGDMLRLAVKSNLVVDSGGSETRDNIELLPLCPKPRRLRSTTPEILKPLRCNKHRFALFQLI